MASSSVASDAAIPPADQSGSSQTFVLHVLCPSLPPPNRFTFNDLTPPTTVAGLKARISQSLPGQPSSEIQRLIYRGKPLTSDSILLENVLDLENGSEHSMHLVLPPAPLPAANDTGSLSSAAPPQQASNIPTPPFDSLSAPPNNAQVRSPVWRIRDREPPVPGDDEMAQTVRQSIEAIHRQLESQERRRFPLPERQEGAISTSIHHSFGAPLRTQTHLFGMPNTSFADDTRLLLLQLQPQVTYFEDQLSRGIAPPIDRIIQVRSQLLQLLDEQYRKPQSERNSSIEPLLTRVFNIYTRADQLRVMQSTLPSSLLRPNSANISGGVETNQIPRYLLSSPDGYRGIITSPGTTEGLQAALEAIRVAQASQAAFTPNHGHHPAEAHPNANANAAVMENAVRQAVLNQRAGANHGGLGIARSIRRLWLFVRLYFFCYMFSEPGTWTRVLFVSLAVLAALLSETGYPQQLYRMLVAPVQQHLEGLVHFAPGTDNAAETNNANQPAGARNGGRGGLAAELRHNLRRVERSLALFIASLVPGVGERHVEVRNAAEAARNAERTREEEDRRRREEAAANPVQDQQQPQDSEQRSDDRDASAPPDPAQQNPTGDHPPGATASQGDENRAV
ncbi:hypothetical protein P170DRAFT_407617 [Aspergillus steynii IBT 23096]|uniref:Ubiquitin-like domain-containing protein n=1 Tax=Aspergillus steynii IBT 23096 TaxID=1392250 RepID=A0A2I2G7M4_9EURO|nr:uncharacterized protein P170DRAFT_407617 [Aspergillus steynii IBT 23096]PLB48879.1 hypothetical protein P170DRAFT_407617 [Aspergillus steynii IBT 23096]